MPPHDLNEASQHNDARMARVRRGPYLGAYNKNKAPGFKGSRGPRKGHGGRPPEADPMWWANHIERTAKNLARTRQLAIDVLEKTRGYSSTKNKDWSIIRDTARRLAPTGAKGYAYGITRFCYPVRKRLRELMGY